MKKQTFSIISTFIFTVLMNSTLNAQALGPQSNANHTVGLHSDGTVYSWGLNSNGQLGGWYDHRSRYPCTSVEGRL